MSQPLEQTVEVTIDGRHYQVIVYSPNHGSSHWHEHGHPDEGVPASTNGERHYHHHHNEKCEWLPALLKPID